MFDRNKNMQRVPRQREGCVMEQAKIGDVIECQLSVYSHGKLLRVILATQEAVEFANQELLNKGSWTLMRTVEPRSVCNGSGKRAHD